MDRVATLAVAEVLLRLVGADEPGGMHMGGMLMSAMGGGDASAWLAETNLLDRLLDALGGVDDEDRGDDATLDAMTRHANAAEVLVGIARGAPSALATKLASEASMRKLFDRATSRRGEGSAYGGDPNAGGGAGVNVEPHEGVEVGSAVTAHDGAHASPLVNVLDIAVAVVDAKRAAGPAQAMQAFLAAEIGGAEPPVRQAPPEALAACVEFLPRLVTFLDVDDDASGQRTTWGVMAPPLGLMRVKTVDALAVFLGSKSDAVAEAMLSCDALPACFRLFHRYPFNNFLHHHVESMIDTVLEWGHPGLLERLFASVDEGGCDVVGMIADAPQTVETARGPARSGNLGHVTRIGNRLAAVAAGGADEGADEDGAEDGAERAGASPDAETRRADAETRRATTAFVAAKLEADARWAPHVDGPLKQRNTVENVYKWACGRPAGMDDGGMGEHSAEEDDHDFDVGLGGGGFTRDGFDRYGGVGLDDDDEDDEEDDDGPVPPGAAGLFQGDASARLASLTLSNAPRARRTTTTTRRAAKAAGPRRKPRGSPRPSFAFRRSARISTTRAGSPRPRRTKTTWYSATTTTPTRTRPPSPCPPSRRRAKTTCAPARTRRARRRFRVCPRVPFAHSIQTRRRRARRRRSRWNTTRTSPRPSSRRRGTGRRHRRLARAGRRVMDAGGCGVRGERCWVRAGEGRGRSTRVDVDRGVDARRGPGRRARDAPRSRTEFPCFYVILDPHGFSRRNHARTSTFSATPARVSDPPRRADGENRGDVFSAAAAAPEWQLSADGGHFRARRTTVTREEATVSARDSHTRALSSRRPPSLASSRPTPRLGVDSHHGAQEGVHRQEERGDVRPDGASRRRGGRRRRRRPRGPRRAGVDAQGR